jgi:competence protein ComEC
MLTAVPIWQRAPILRPLLSLAGGILLQRAWPIPEPALELGLAAPAVLLVLVSLQAMRQRFRWRVANGVLAHAVFFLLGMKLLHHRHEVLQRPLLQPTGEQAFVVLKSFPVEKSASFLILAERREEVREGLQRESNGTCLLYFAKDPPVLRLHPGQRLLLLKPLQLLHRSRNPGAFEYRDYCYLQGITHQAYLRNEDYRVVGGEERPWPERLVQHLQQWVLATIRSYVPGERERGLAEALLIGYKNDLDRDLVQAYSDTGVVHVIAISGLHLGLIYALALLLTRPLARWKWLRIAVVLSSLWLFTLLAGAGPSVLRSAVMFTFLALGPVLDRRTHPVNTLALSAFVLLCYDPFWLWDAGFQLSYSAVLSIFLFYHPVYALAWFPNRLLDLTWQLIAVTIAAQILTLPVSVYHFHQLPTLFLLTNVLAVPLSSLILLAEIALCALAGLPLLAGPLGQFVALLIRWMNAYIERLAALPFATWGGLLISGGQAILLTAFLLAAGFFLMEGKKALAWLGGMSLLLFFLIRTQSFATAEAQKRVVVYDAGKGRALGLIAGRKQWLYADRAAQENRFFPQTIRSANILYRTSNDSLATFPAGTLPFGNRTITCIDAAHPLIPGHTDLLLVSGKVKPALTSAHRLQQVVADGTVTPWYLQQWKQACDSLKIPFHSIRDSGACIIDLENQPLSRDKARGY